MKEDYNYDFPENGDGSIFGCSIALVWCIWFIISMLIATTIDDRGAGGLLGALLAFLPLIILLIVAGPAQAGFTADEHTVTFRYLLKKTVIAYENIKSIEVKAEYREERGKGINKYYAEVITFHCADGNGYTFAGKLDTDFEEILKDPSYLQKLTENSKFSRLKRYIEERIYINI